MTGTGSMNGPVSAGGLPAFPPGCEDADPERVFFPDVTVHLSTGHSGNMGAVLATVHQALGNSGDLDAAEAETVMKWLRARVFAADSYTEALSWVMRTVDVT
jgi:hypothetical protein